MNFLIENHLIKLINNIAAPSVLVNNMSKLWSLKEMLSINMQSPAYRAMNTNTTCISTYTERKRGGSKLLIF